MYFYKYHGLGNDFIIIEDFEAQLADKYAGLAKELCTRHFNIGADGLVFINAEQKKDSPYQMRIFNPDGSEAEMCGNAIRCVGKHLYERKFTADTSLIINTKADDKLLTLDIVDNKVNNVTVNMGTATWQSSNIPVVSNNPIVLNEPFKVDNEIFNLSCVSMGNPHAVCIIKEPDYSNLAIEHWGPLLEKHKRFPNLTNVEFIKIIDQNTIEMKVWERGAGQTLACGTGACASTAISNRLGLTSNKVLVKLLGGNLTIDIKDNIIYMTGPAVKVYEGNYN